MKRDISNLLEDIIIEALRAIGINNIDESDFYLDFPSDPRFGDLFTNVAFLVGKKNKIPPQDIARSIKEFLSKKITNSFLSRCIKEIKIEGPGFINFYLRDEYFYKFLFSLVKKGNDFLRARTKKSKKALIEFVSANPTGPLSVAHARQAAVGDSLANILSFMGFTSKKEYYLNDEGNQINILGKSVELRMRELKGEKIVFPEECYQGEYIYDIARKAILENRGYIGLGDYAAEYILKGIKGDLKDFGVDFDNWYSQKALTRSGKIRKAFRFLEKRGFLYSDGGALWFKSSSFGDDKDRVVLKSDGSYTYLAPDIAYHEDKFRRGFHWLINLWGPDHHGYINRLKASVQAFGHTIDSLSIVIVQLATIYREGKPIQMSTRRGQYITLREVLDEVGADASRFFFLMRRTSSHLDFDIDIAKKHTPENPVYYIQYAHARICSILKSSGRFKYSDTDIHLLKEKEEIELIKRLSKFSDTLNICIKTTDPYMLTVYLQEIAECFHRFYDRHRVLGQQPNLTQARLSLIKGTKIILESGLRLLGISTPEEM